MQALSTRDAGLGRRGRISCPRCGRVVDLFRFRAHLREAHSESSTDVEREFLDARRRARRADRPRLRY